MARGYKGGIYQSSSGRQVATVGDLDDWWLVTGHKPVELKCGYKEEKGGLF